MQFDRLLSIEQLTQNEYFNVEIADLKGGFEFVLPLTLERSNIRFLSLDFFKIAGA